MIAANTAYKKNTNEYNMGSPATPVRKDINSSAIPIGLHDRPQL